MDDPVVTDGQQGLGRDDLRGQDAATIGESGAQKFQAIMPFSALGDAGWFKARERQTQIPAHLRLGTKGNSELSDDPPKSIWACGWWLGA